MNSDGNAGASVLMIHILFLASGHTTKPANHFFRDVTFHQCSPSNPSSLIHCYLVRIQLQYIYTHTHTFELRILQTANSQNWIINHKIQVNQRHNMSVLVF